MIKLLQIYDTVLRQTVTQANIGIGDVTQEVIVLWGQILWLFCVLYCASLFSAEAHGKNYPNIFVIDKAISQFFFL